MRGTLWIQVRQCYVHLKTDSSADDTWWENCLSLPHSFPPSFRECLPSARMEGQEEPPLGRFEHFAKTSMKLPSQLMWCIVVLDILLKDIVWLDFIFISTCGIPASCMVPSLHWWTEVYRVESGAEIWLSPPARGGTHASLAEESQYRPLVWLVHSLRNSMATPLLGNPSPPFRPIFC